MKLKQKTFNNIYISSIVVTKCYRHQRFARILIRHMAQIIEMLYQKEIYFNKIIVDAVSEDGRYIAENILALNFHKQSNHNSHIYLWEQEKCKELCLEQIKIMKKIKR